MTSKTRKKPILDLQTQKALHKKVENSWILLLNDEVFCNNKFEIVTLPHPGQGSPAKFCLDAENKKVYEVVTFDEPYRSWFVDETVKSDGRMLMLTPINPIFLVLPCLRDQCTDKAVPLEDLTLGKGYEKLSDFITDLSKVADLKGPPDMKAYKYNEKKTLSWLKERISNVSDVIKTKNINVRSGAVSATFISSSMETDTIDDEFYLKYAFGLVSQYLQEDMADVLEKEYNFKTELVESLSKKRKSEAKEDQATKKIKHEQNNFTENSITSTVNSGNEIKKPKQLSAKEISRQKAASGTKTISSFFTKK